MYVCIYVYTYIYMYMCVCVCVCIGRVDHSSSDLRMRVLSC